MQLMFSKPWFVITGNVWFYQQQVYCTCASLAQVYWHCHERDLYKSQPGRQQSSRLQSLSNPSSTSQPMSFPQAGLLSPYCFIKTFYTLFHISQLLEKWIFLLCAIILGYLPSDRNLLSGLVCCFLFTLPRTDPDFPPVPLLPLSSHFGICFSIK